MKCSFYPSTTPLPASFPINYLTSKFFHLTFKSDLMGKYVSYSIIFIIISEQTPSRVICSIFSFIPFKSHLNCCNCLWKFKLICNLADAELCNCWCQSAYKGNALQTKSSHKQWTGRFHYYMFNNNPQFIKQGPTIWISSRGIPKSKKSIVYERLEQTSLTTKKHKNCSRHQEYFITSNEFQNILLIST